MIGCDRKRRTRGRSHPVSFGSVGLSDPLQEPRIGQLVQRVDEVGGRRHVLVPVDDQEPALQEGLEQRVGPGDDGVDRAAAARASEGLEGGADEVRVRPHDESIERQRFATQ